MDTFKTCILVFIIAFINAGNSDAQEEDPNRAVEFWSRMSFRWITKKSIQHDFEFQYRNQQRVASLQERFQLYTFRWSIQKRWDSFYTQSSPVTFFERLTSEGVLVNEYRLTQHVGYFFAEDKIQLRTGVEGRFFWSEGTNWQEVRWRTRLLFFIPLNDQLRIQTGDEVSFHKNNAVKEVPFFDQNRIVLGLNWQVTKKWTVDSGYQFQTRSFKQGEFDNFHVIYFYLNYLLSPPR